MVALLESRNDEEIARCLRTLILLSYGTEIELKERAGLLNALVRVIQRGRNLPQPIQVIFIQGSEEYEILKFNESTDAFNDEDGCIDRFYNEYMPICTSTTRKLTQRQNQVFKILLNLSFIPNNKVAIANHIPTTCILIEFLQQERKVKTISQILANIGKYVSISNQCSCLPTIVDLLFNDDWDIVLFALEFFKKNIKNANDVSFFVCL